MAMVKCPHCGEEFFLEENEKQERKSRKPIIIVVIAAAVVLLAIGVYYLIQNADPIRKYDRLMAQGKSAEAQDLYNSRIATDEELEQQVLDREAEEIDALRNGYLSKEKDYESTVKALDAYAAHEESAARAGEVKKEIEKTHKSREAYIQATQKEAAGDIDAAIIEYRKVSKDDEENYHAAQDRITELTKHQKDLAIQESKKLADAGEYQKAIEEINAAGRSYGQDDTLEGLLQEYTDKKSVMYAAIKVTDKSTTPKNTGKWIFSNYVNFVFEVTNNSDKAIKGIEGSLRIDDLFGKEIMEMGCDFTGQTIAPGETYTEKKLSFECNEFVDSHMKLFNTAYDDLVFTYNIDSIVFADGSTVNPG